MNDIPNINTLCVDTYKSFCNKTVECPYIINSRTSIGINDINYVPGKDNRISCKKIDVKLTSEWIENRDMVECPKVKILNKKVELKSKIVKKGDPEKYFRLFFEDFSKTSKSEFVNIESDKLLELYKIFIEINKTCSSDIYLDNTFNRELNKCIFLLNKRVETGNREEGIRKRTTIRIIDIKLLKKWLE
jgi:hypothetical protein